MALNQRRKSRRQPSPTGAALCCHRVMFCLRMPSQMHRKGEGTSTLGTKQGTVSVTAPREHLALRLGEPQHATDRLYPIGRDALSGNARQASLLAFLSSELR